MRKIIEIAIIVALVNVIAIAIMAKHELIIELLMRRHIGNVVKLAIINSVLKFLFRGEMIIITKSTIMIMSVISVIIPIITLLAQKKLRVVLPLVLFVLTILTVCDFLNQQQENMENMFNFGYRNVERIYIILVISISEILKCILPRIKHETILDYFEEEEK